MHYAGHSDYTEKAIARAADEGGIAPPAITVVGDVVAALAGMEDLG